MTFSGFSFTDFQSLLWLLLFIAGAVVVIALAYWVSIKVVKANVFRKRIGRQNKKYIVLILPLILAFLAFGLINIMYTGYQELVFALIVAAIPIAIILFSGSYAKSVHAIKTFDDLVGHHMTDIQVGHIMLEGTIERVDDSGWVTCTNGIKFSGVSVLSMKDKSDHIREEEITQSPLDISEQLL